MAGGSCAGIGPCFHTSRPQVEPGKSLERSRQQPRRESRSTVLLHVRRKSSVGGILCRSVSSLRQRVCALSVSDRLGTNRSEGRRNGSNNSTRSPRPTPSSDTRGQRALAIDGSRITGITALLETGPGTASNERVRRIGLLGRRVTAGTDQRKPHHPLHQHSPSDISDAEAASHRERLEVRAICHCSKLRQGPRATLLRRGRRGRRPASHRSLCVRRRRAWNASKFAFAQRSSLAFISSTVR